MTCLHIIITYPLLTYPLVAYPLITYLDVHFTGQKARHLMQQLNSDVVAQMVVERIKFHTERRGWIL